MPSSKIIHCFFLWLMSANPLLAQNFDAFLYTQTNGYRHASISDGIQAIEMLAKSNAFSVYHSEDSSLFNDSHLDSFDLVIFLNTSGNILNADQQNALKKYIQNGGGYVGIHAASDTEHDWSWYGDLVGRHFKNHPAIQQATLNIQDTAHSSTDHLPATWQRTDEWYNFETPFPSNLNVLVTIDESTYTGGNMGAYHPLSWYHNYDGGRSFYTAMGHTDSSYYETYFLNHILGGITWASGMTSSAVHNNPVNHSFEIYPNPAERRIVIEGKYHGLRKVEVVDLEGRIMYSKEIENFPVELNISELDSGMYFIRMNSSWLISRFVKR